MSQTGHLYLAIDSRSVAYAGVCNIFPIMCKPNRQMARRANMHHRSEEDFAQSNNRRVVSSAHPLFDALSRRGLN